MSYQNKFEHPVPHNLPPETKAYITSLITKLKQEFRAIQNSGGSRGGTIIRTSGGGGGGGSTSTGTIAVKSADLTTQIANVDDLRFVTDDGFTVTDLGGGIARIGFTQTIRDFYRSGSLAVSPTGTTVPFSSEFETSDTILVRATSCRNADNLEVGVSITSVDSVGFIATPIEDATLEYMAQPIWIPQRGFVVAPANVVTTVPLTFSYPDTNYTILLQASYNSDGLAVGIDWSNKQVDTFDINPIETAFIYYEAQYYN